MLEQSLYVVARLELGLTTQPDAVEDVWNVLVQRPEQTPQPLPPGTRISTVFDDFGTALLILGAPGTGKTTLLLELTKDLLARAEQDPNHPLPVVFNLSSWAVRKSPLAAWLVDELCKYFQVPRNYPQSWIDKDLIIPLLDGLDEVASAHRSACVEAINAFRGQHGLVPLVVCSRVADYAALTTMLHLPGALVVQPLTRQQVDHYLAQAGKPLAGVRTALQDDETLWELLDTPLMLSVAALAFQGRSAAEMQITGTLEERKTQLFAAYTDAMFKRRGKFAPCSRQQTIQWLAWLAAAMTQHNQSIFYIEGMQPDWLPTQALQRRFNVVAAILSGLIGCLGGLVLCLVLVILRLSGLDGGLAFILGGGLGGLVGCLKGVGKPIKPVERMRWSWTKAKENLVFKLLHGWLIFGLLWGLILGLIFFEWRDGLVNNLVFGLFWGLVLGPIGGLIEILNGALTNETIKIRVIPNEGIRRSLQNALFLALFWGLVWGLACGLVVGFTIGWFWDMFWWDPDFGLFFGLFFMLFLGLVGGLRNGGFAYLQHFTLRFLLWRNGFAPWRYVRFLDYAAERVFLRKVGGGYIFVHRMLLEYFAALHPSHRASPDQAPVNE